MSEPEAMYYLKELIQGLKYLQKHKVIHRDQQRQCSNLHRGMVRVNENAVVKQTTCSDGRCVNVETGGIGGLPHMANHSRAVDVAGLCLDEIHPGHAIREAWGEERETLLPIDGACLYRPV